jgi:hypothetical protein
MQLPDTPGLIPWAALAAGDSSQACAFITPCHWHITPDQVHQTDPASAPLDEDESRQLLALIAPWFSDDGITLEYLRADLWLARGAAFKDLATASMDRALGRDVRPGCPTRFREPSFSVCRPSCRCCSTPMSSTTACRTRSAAHQLLLGAWHGSLPACPQRTAAVCVDDLRHTALQGNVQGWQKAWQALDSGLIAELQQRAARGEPVKLTLCGERNAVQWQSQPRGLMDKIKSVFGTKRLPDLREML